MYNFVQCIGSFALLHANTSILFILASEELSSSSKRSRAGNVI